MALEKGIVAQRGLISMTRTSNFQALGLVHSRAKIRTEMCKSTVKCRASRKRKRMDGEGISLSTVPAP